jgi:hypothetical protein
VKCGDKEVTDFVDHTRSVIQGFSVSTYSFNIFIDDVIDYISKGNMHAPIMGQMSIPGLLFADDLATGSFTVNGLQKGIDQVVNYYRKLNLKCNLKKRRKF